MPRRTQHVIATKRWAIIKALTSALIVSGTSAASEGVLRADSCDSMR